MLSVYINLVELWEMDVEIGCAEAVSAHYRVRFWYQLDAVYEKQLLFYKESLAIIGNFTTFAPKEIID